MKLGSPTPRRPHRPVYTDLAKRDTANLESLSGHIRRSLRDERCGGLVTPMRAALADVESELITRLIIAGRLAGAA